MTNQEILDEAGRLEEYVIECRRKIHRFAEPSGTEIKTSAFVQEEAKASGLPFYKVSSTGLVLIALHVRGFLCHLWLTIDLVLICDLPCFPAHNTYNKNKVDVKLERS